MRSAPNTCPTWKVEDYNSRILDNILHRRYAQPKKTIVTDIQWWWTPDDLSQLMEVHNSILARTRKGSRDLTRRSFPIEHGPYSRSDGNVGTGDWVSLIGPGLRFELPNQLLMAISIL